MAWKTEYETDFVRDFTVNDTGKDASGKPCWLSRFPYGRVVNNNEVGVYADPVLFPTTNPFPIVDRKRHLRSERLAKPIDWHGKSYAYSGALMSAPHLPLSWGMRVECRIAMPHAMRKGHWGGLWFLAKNGSWPPELDLVEHFTFNEGDKIGSIWNTLHSVKDGEHVTDQRSISLAAVGIPGDVTQPLTYAVEFWSKDVLCFINDKLVAKRQHTIPAGGWYPVLDLAVAGNPWPGAPDANTQFPQDMILHDMKVYRQA